MKPVVLVTGFEPFGGQDRNPSGNIAELLDTQCIEGRTIVGQVLPVEFERSHRRLSHLVRKLAPELVICLGVAGNRLVISLERVAVNLDDARIVDNAGKQPTDQPIGETRTGGVLVDLARESDGAGFSGARSRSRTLDVGGDLCV
ncbi:MAG: hypothetical protein J6386_21685 [Candidatus Synoicihabitans palmerolidicus]|nr:hypothetical protein [Candidatus Synoicihabitans palmerolidicus]